MTAPDASGLREAVEALHTPVEVWLYDDTSGTFTTDGNGDKVLLRTLCRECSDEDVIAAVEDCEWHDGWHSGEVDWPCATVALLAAHPAESDDHEATGWAVHAEHVDRANREALHLNSVIDELKTLLRRACEPDAREDCSFDHNGGCQAHGFLSEPCPYPPIRQYLAGPEADPTAGERHRCDTCGDTGRVPWMVEADPNCYMEPDSEGMVPCPDCLPAAPPADDASEGLSEAEALAREVCPCTDDPNGTHVPDLDAGCGWALALCRAVVASDWLVARVSAAATRARAEGAAEALRNAARDVPYETGIQWGRPDWQKWLRDRAARIARSDAAPDAGGA